MGFLWMGSKNIKDFSDFKVRDLKKEQIALNVRWDICQADRSNASNLYENYKAQGIDAATKDQVDRAAYEMGRQSKSIRAAEQEINVTQKRLGIIDSILDMKKLVGKETDRHGVWGKIRKLDSDSLERLFTDVAETRKTEVLNLETVNRIVTSHSEPMVVKAERDADTNAALKEILRARDEAS